MPLPSVILINSPSIDDSEFKKSRSRGRRKKVKSNDKSSETINNKENKSIIKRYSKVKKKSEQDSLSDDTFESNRKEIMSGQIISKYGDSIDNEKSNDSDVNDSDINDSDVNDSDVNDSDINY